MGRFTLVKLTMFLVNLLISVAGLTLLVTGVWAIADGGYLEAMLAPFSRRALNVSILCTALGAGLLVLGLLGCCGAFRESKCLLLAFISVLLSVFVANVASGVVVLAYSSFAENVVQTFASTMLREDYGAEPLVTKFWNTTMSKLACCGYSSYMDFEGSRFLELTAGIFPPTCCRTPAPCRLAEVVHSNMEGCAQSILRMLTEHADITGGVAVGVGTLEITAMTVSLYLYHRIDKMTKAKA
ncbi:unnamed protein product [Ophioblennius macclurei]